MDFDLYPNTSFPSEMFLPEGAHYEEKDPLTRKQLEKIRARRKRVLKERLHKKRLKKGRQ